MQKNIYGAKICVKKKKGKDHLYMNFLVSPKNVSRRIPIKLTTLTTSDETGWAKKRGRREPFHGTVHGEF